MALLLRKEIKKYRKEYSLDYAPFFVNPKTSHIIGRRHQEQCWLLIQISPLFDLQAILTFLHQNHG
jgi:hypothetical protein